jgi:hypothetical protein
MSKPSKSCAALSASLEEWIWIFGDMSSEARLWSSYQSVGFQLDQIFLRSEKIQSAEYTGRRSESRMPATVISDSRKFWCTTMRRSPLPSTGIRRALLSWNFEDRTNKYFQELHASQVLNFAGPNRVLCFHITRQDGIKPNSSVMSVSLQSLRGDL